MLQHPTHTGECEQYRIDKERQFVEIHLRTIDSSNRRWRSL